jgi:hypothetical protein
MTWMTENNRRDWATAIAEINARRNQEWTRTINCTPFQMFFARDPYAMRGELDDGEKVDFDAEEDFAEGRPLDDTESQSDDKDSDVRTEPDGQREVQLL